MGTSSVFDLFGTAAAPTGLTAAYVGGNTIPCGGDFNQLCLYITVAGFDATSIEWKVQLSDDSGTTWFDELTEEVSAGVVTQLAAIRSVPAANGTYAVYVPLPAVTHMRVTLKRTGGSAATTVHVSGTAGLV